MQDHPAYSSGVAASADHRYRSGGEQGPQARHVGPALPVGHRVQVGFPARVRCVVGQVEGQLGDTVHRRAVGVQPRVGEYPQHRGILGQHFRGESPHPPVTGRRHEVLEQQGGHAPVMGMVGDGYRELRRTGSPLAFVAGHADQLAGQPGEQGGVVGCGCPADPAGFLVGGGRAHAEEAQVQVVRRHRLVHLAHGLEVAGRGRADLGRRPIGEERVHTGGGLCGSHRSSEGGLPFS